MAKFRLHSQERRRAANDGAHGRRGIEAGSRAYTWHCGLRLIQNHQYHIARIFAGKACEKRVEALARDIAAIDHLLRRSGLASDEIARHFRTPSGTLLDIEPEEIAHGGAG